MSLKDFLISTKFNAKLILNFINGHSCHDFLKGAPQFTESFIRLPTCD